MTKATTGDGAWQRILPPLLYTSKKGVVADVAHALRYGGLAFFARWLLGGPGFYALAAVYAWWDHAYQLRSGDKPSLSHSLVRAYAFFICGVGGLWNAIGHTVLADQVARAIGWDVGSPFQLELAAAHLGWGVAGLMAARLNWQALGVVVVTKCVFLFGAAAVHLRDIVIHGNRSPLNAGFLTLWFGDVIVPIGVLLFVVVGSRAPRGATA